MVSLSKRKAIQKYGIKLRKEKKEKGICQDCNNKVKKEHIFCDYHLKKRRNQSRKFLLKRKWKKKEKL